MKKITALLLCLVMILSAVFMVGCDEYELWGDDDSESSGSKTLKKLDGKTPKKLYEATLESMKTLTNYRLESRQEILMTAGTEKMEMNQVVVCEKDGYDEYGKTTNDMVDGLDNEYWYVDGMYYIMSASGNMKAEISYEEIIEKYAPEGSKADGALLVLPDEWLVDAKFVREDSNSYYLEFTASGEEFLKFMDKLNIANGVDISSIENIVYKVYFDKKGNLEEIKTQFSLVVEGVNAEYDITTTISKVGEVTITKPEGGDSWTDVTGRI